MTKDEPVKKKASNDFQFNIVYGQKVKAMCIIKIIMLSKTLKV
jgi:hypothetical protein